MKPIQCLDLAAINHDLPRLLVNEIAALTLTMVVVSIIPHGISVTPLMNLYAVRKRSPGAKAGDGPLSDLAAIGLDIEPALLC